MLYFVPTPIWNKEDITLRALRLLKEINILICEDTRTAKKLLSMYDISTVWKEFYSITSFTSQGKLGFYAKLLQENDAVVVSEAWTPGLSDPWKSLVQLCTKKYPPFCWRWKRAAWPRPPPNWGIHSPAWHTWWTHWKRSSAWTCWYAAKTACVSLLPVWPWSRRCRLCWLPPRLWRMKPPNCAREAVPRCGSELIQV